MRGDEEEEEANENREGLAKIDMRLCMCHLLNTQKKGIPPCRKVPHVSKEDDELSAMQPTALVVHHHLIPSPYIPAIHLPFPVDHPAFSKDVPTPIQ